MTRRPWLNDFKLSEREHTRRAIHASRLRRLIPALAIRLGLDAEALSNIAERTLCLCAICISPMPVPRLYRIDGEVRALICGRCDAAIEKTGGELLLLRRHRRFSSDYPRNRGRLARLVSLHSSVQ